jgi:hypothetical protein
LTDGDGGEIGLRARELHRSAGENAIAPGNQISAQIRLSHDWGDFAEGQIAAGVIRVVVCVDPERKVTNRNHMIFRYNRFNAVDEKPE